MICLADVNENNFEALRRLDVAPEQRRFLDSPLGILARGYVYRTQRARVLAVLAEGEPVGLLLVKDMDEEPACYDLQQFMIDRRYQGKGYGKAAMRLILDFIATQPCGPAELCWLSYGPENTAAKALYAAFGFRETGEWDGDEVIAVKPLGKKTLI
jgi:ribosomal protein S18 acetylase RimI-like enzyme